MEFFILSEIFFLCCWFHLVQWDTFPHRGRPLYSYSLSTTKMQVNRKMPNIWQASAFITWTLNDQTNYFSSASLSFYLYWSSQISRSQAILHQDVLSVCMQPGQQCSVSCMKRSHSTQNTFLHAWQVNICREEKTKRLNAILNNKSINVPIRKILN